MGAAACGRAGQKNLPAGLRAKITGQVTSLLGCWCTNLANVREKVKEVERRRLAND